MTRYNRSSSSGGRKDRGGIRHGHGGLELPPLLTLSLLSVQPLAPPGTHF